MELVKQIRDDWRSQTEVSGQRLATRCWSPGWRGKGEVSWGAGATQQK